MTTDTTADSPEPETAPVSQGDNNDGHTDTSSGAKNEARRIPWERALYMALFGFVGYWTFWAIIVIAFIQLIVVSISQKPNDDLQGFSRNLTEYLRQIIAYLGFGTEEKPCPFADFPRVNPQSSPPE